MAVVLDSGDYPKCQADALARAGWADFPARQQAARKAGHYLGIGVANFCKGTGRGPFESATVRIGPSGKVHVYSGAAAMVMISTDKAIEPVSMLGLTKRFAEMYCQALDHDLATQAGGKPRMRLISVRFGNVLASNGSAATWRT